MFLLFGHIHSFRLLLYGLVLLIGTLVGIEIPLLIRILKDKLSFKDQHRLKELDALIHALPADIAAHESLLADARFYARDPSGFDSTMKALDAARAKLEAAEEEWLELEGKREALATS